MKTYLRRSQEKSLSTIFYSSSDNLNNFRQRIVQPSTKEQQRLLSSQSSSKFQHVHWGKYGIKPIWPSEKSICEQFQQGKKLTKHRSSSISSISSKAYRNQCFRYQSDLQKKTVLPTTSFIPYFNQEYGSILIISLASLFILLLVFIVYRRQSTKINEKKQLKERRRQNFDDNLLIREPFESSSSIVQSLPTINEESPNPIKLSPKILYPELNSNTKPTSTVVKDNNDSRNSSSTSSRQPTSLIDNINNNKESLVPTVPVVKEEKPPIQIQRRRSRFEADSTKSNTQLPSTVKDTTPPVFQRKTSVQHENVIKDDFSTLEEINKAVKEVGLEHSELIFGIDYTISNLETGKNSFHGRSLHHIEDGLLNPYQSVISIIGRTLEKYDSDTRIPAFGFGDRSTLDRKIFPLRRDGAYCKGFQGVLEAYNEITPKVRMSGPTNFAPLIREAVRIVKKTGKYHILVIVADGQVTNEEQTKEAIVEASNHPLSIVMIGVGDGPWDMMNEFDDSLPTRVFDNFQFVNYNDIVKASTNSDSTFALRALMEIPSQYAAIKNLGLLKDS